MSNHPYDIGPPYMVQYRHDGKDYAFNMGAENWQDAQDRLRSIGFNGRIVGSGVRSFSANALTLPIVSIWVRLFVWWKNLWGRRP